MPSMVALSASPVNEGDVIMEGCSHALNGPWV